MKLILAIVVVAAVFVALVLVKFLSDTTDGAANSESIVKPDEWPAWQAELDKHKLAALKISLSDKKPTSPWQSKVGGTPYWPNNLEYPKDQNGKPLHMVAQINFSEVPDNLADFPDTGVLQFFVASNDIYGVEFPDREIPFDQFLNKRRNFAVIYHEEINQDRANLSASLNHTTGDDMLPVQGASAITFNRIQDTANPLDYRFDKITKALGQPSDKISDYAYETIVSPPSHKMGGYAFFTQWDPRPVYDPYGEWLLLFQLDTDSNNTVDIMWGDSGVGNFFIRPGDLKKRDFSKVWYSWDCY